MAEESTELERLKKAHDLYVTTFQILTHRVQFYAEEFDGVKELIDFHKRMAHDLRSKIEALEPKEETDGEKAD